MPEKTIQQVMNAHVDGLMSHAGVVGVAVGLNRDGAPCIQVLVEEMSHELRRNIPAELDGYPVLVVVTGEIRGMTGDGE